MSNPRNKDIDLKAAINAISDVVQNRPRPIRDFDQIYMKTGDMVLQAELVARWADGKKLAFIGDGDSISVCVAYLQKKKIFDYGPTKIVVFDFDERMCSAITRFADKARLDHLESRLYNCLEKFPALGAFDMFYTNPPWGQSNLGESINVFMQRGMEATGYEGGGLVVIADDDEISWPHQVLHNVQRFAINSGFFVSKLMPKLHLYHLDDAPDLKSCNLFFKAVPGGKRPRGSKEITDKVRLKNFYGRENYPKIRYVREKKRLDYGKAHDDEYTFEFLERKKK